MARPLSSISVYGRSLPVGPFDGSLFSNGLDQLLSTSGGTTVVSRPPMKKKMSAATTKPMALLSVFCNMSVLLPSRRGGPTYFCRPSDRGHDVEQESHNSAKDQRAGEEAHRPDRFERDYRIDERDRRVIPLPALPESAQPERDEEAEAADHE